MHQLAKKFTITGLPVRRSASVSGASPGRNAGRSSFGAGRPTTTEPIEAGSRPLVSDQAKKPAISASVSSGRMKRRRRIYSAGCSGGA